MNKRYAVFLAAVLIGGLAYVVSNNLCALSTVAHFSRGIVHATNGEFREAADSFQTAISLDPRHDHGQDARRGWACLRLEAELR